MQSFPLSKAREPGNLLLEAVAGSNAYGLATQHSDVDIRGIFVLPKKHLHGLHYTQQVNDRKHDVTLYELGRFFSLALANNPNILELLAMPEDCILFQHPLAQELKPQLFLSKLARNTFLGYATQQISKARGMKKKIVNPMSEQRKTVLEFCFVTVEGKSLPLLDWLADRGMTQTQCGLAKLAHMKGFFALYHDATGSSGFQGIMKNPSANDVCLSSIPKGSLPLAYLHFNKDGYSAYCKDYLT
jgi:hypothetical protein